MTFVSHARRRGHAAIGVFVGPAFAFTTAMRLFLTVTLLVVAAGFADLAMRF
jgi:hypothetical protein